MDYGIKVSQEGYDVSTTDDTKLIMETNSNLLKVAYSGTITITGGSISSITHNLGYEPQFLVFVETAAGVVRMATAVPGLGAAGVDTTKLYITIDDSGSFDCYYYIFYEELNTGTAPTVISTNNYGIKVVKDGFNVATANILQQTFNSEKNCLKIFAEGTLNHVGTGTDVTYSHGLGSIPSWMAWFQVDDSGNWFTQGSQEPLSGKGVIVNAWSTSTQFVSRVTVGSGSADVDIRYILFVDPAN